MKYSIEILEEAKIEYKKSFDWYKIINPILAKRFLSSFKARLVLLKKDPFLFQIRYDEVRVIMFENFPYLIHYRIIDDKIIIQSICHTSRDGELNIF